MTQAHDECPLAAAARNWPHATALRDARRSMTFLEWHRYADDVATAFHRAGWRRGDCVGLQAQPTIEFLIVTFGLWRAGVVTGLVSPRWPLAVRLEMSSQVGWTDFLTATDQLACIREAIAPSSPSSRTAPTFDETTATVLFSSGSLGHPRAIAHSLSAHLANARGANTNMPLSPSQSWLLSLSPAHVGGLGIVFRTVLAGACCLLPESGQALDQSINTYSPSHLSLVPTQLSRLLKTLEKPADGLHAVLLGGAPIASSLCNQAIAKRWPLYTTYGLTEMASQVTTTPKSSTHDDLTTAGYVLADREIMIGAQNEIQVRGAPLFQGYIVDRRVQSATNDAGWFATRDRGYLDECQRLVVQGRLDNMFISGGENIYPEEIEQELVQMAGILEAIVVPVDHPEYGQRPVAFIDGDWSLRTRWEAILLERLPKFKIPDRLWPLPASDMLKRNRRELCALANHNMTR